MRAAATLRDLPAVGEAARAGAIGFGHVNSFTYALKHVGVDATRQLEGPLLEVAKERSAGIFEEVAASPGAQADDQDATDETASPDEDESPSPEPSPTVSSTVWPASKALPSTSRIPAWCSRRSRGR